MTHTVLFELGCEELPPKSLKTLRDALKAETEKGLNDAGLNFAAIEAYAAPRRLALKIVILLLHRPIAKNVLMALRYKPLMMRKASQPKP